MKKIAALSFAVMVVVLGCGNQNAVDEAIKKAYPGFLTVTVHNNTAVARVDEPVVLSMSDLLAQAPNFNAAGFVIFDQKTELPSQANDLDSDGQFDQIVCLVDFQPNEAKKIQVRYGQDKQKRDYPKRTQAELSIKVGGKFVERKYIGGTFQNVDFLRVPPEHTDHSEFIRYEGPGWESDKIGYRFYLDWRNATDIFGKKAPDMVLQNVGLDGFESYHNPAPWGMDVLKVAESLGIGTIAMWHDGQANRVAVVDSSTCQIVLNGPVESLVRTKYFGWKIGHGVYNLTSDLSIVAGSHLTRHDVSVAGDAENLCTGIVKLPEAELFTSNVESGWAYIATFGNQSLVPDTLGMAILFDKKDLIEITGDQYSHVVVLKPTDGKLTYYFLGVWQQEPQGLKSKEEFVAFLEKTVRKLNEPVMVRH